MKMIVVLLTGLLLISSQVYADLSVSDLEKIEAIVNKSISHEIEKIDIKLTEMEKQMTFGFKAVDTQAGRNFNLILGLIALIAFAVGLPQIITALQGRKLQEQAEKYEELRQEVEMLKQERIVRP